MNLSPLSPTSTQISVNGTSPCVSPLLGSLATTEPKSGSFSVASGGDKCVLSEKSGNLSTPVKINVIPPDLTSGPKRPKLEINTMYNTKQPIPNNSVFALNTPIKSVPNSNMAAGFLNAGNSALFTATPNANLGNNINRINFLKGPEKEFLLFGLEANKNWPMGKLGSEKEKIQILFRNDTEKISGMDPAKVNVHKDPHGLNWFQEINANPAKPVEKKLKKIQETSSDLVAGHGSGAFFLADSIKQTALKFRENRATPCAELSYRSFSPKYSKKLIQKVSDLTLNPFPSLSQAFSDPIVPKDYLPTLTRSTYSTMPPLKSLQKLSINDLKSVKNFTIGNEHGKVEYVELDLTQTNLDNIIIEKGGVSLLFKGHPSTYKGLNKKAKITLYNCKPVKPVPYEDFLNILRLHCSSHKAKLLNWDRKSGEWVYIIDSFDPI